MASTSTPSVESIQWTDSYLLGLDALSAEQIRQILHVTHSFEGVQKSDVMQGKVVANLFFEDSTRTRASFNLAAKRLSADVLDFSGKGSSISKGETLRDTARNIEAMGVDVIVCRHHLSGAAVQLAQSVNCGVLNAGDGQHEHPTQGLLDIYTIAKRKDRLADFDLTGLKVAIVGDIAHSRVARSNIHGLQKLGAQVVLVGPATLVPGSFAKMGCEISHSLDDVLPEIDVINMLRVQFERLASQAFPSVREYSSLFGLTQQRMQLAKDDLLVMHPGPINRGLELESQVADGPNSAILQQVTHGLSVRMACLALVDQAVSQQTLSSS